MKHLLLSLTAVLLALTVQAAKPAENKTKEELPRLAAGGTKTYSGTLPVLFINTEGNAKITSKEVYVNATYYIDAMGTDGYESLGTKAAPLTMRIRGRGNYTWTGFDKKPYRIKLDESQPLLGMEKSKNFALLAHADDNLGFMRNTVGFELSRRMGMPYTPAQEPVEVVLNGEYIGLYFLTETIRVDKDRVNIAQQLDNETDPTLITGGWLVEIDNYEDEAQIVVKEGKDSSIKVTYHTPEVLSASQRDYLTQQMEGMVERIYRQDKSSTAWEEIVDMDILARFYVVQELMDNTESFVGSCYIYKDLGEETKWTFGPVWDFGNAFHRGTDQFIYQNPQFGTHLIDEVAKYQRFQDKVRDVWAAFYHNGYADMGTFIDDYAATIASAASSDAAKWPHYGNAEEKKRARELKDRMQAKAEWLISQWGTEPVTPFPEEQEPTDGLASVTSEVGVEVAANSNRQLTITATDDITGIWLFDMAGRIVTHMKPNGKAALVNQKGQRHGAYILKVDTADGKSTRRKIIWK